MEIIAVAIFFIEFLQGNLESGISDFESRRGQRRGLCETSDVGNTLLCVRNNGQKGS